MSALTNFLKTSTRRNEGTEFKPVPVGWYLTQITEVGERPKPAMARICSRCLKFWKANTRVARSFRT